MGDLTSVDYLQALVDPAYRDNLMYRRSVTTFPEGANPFNTPILLNPAGGKHGASNNLANLTRAEYDEWQRVYLPYENRLMDQTTYRNPSLATESASRSMGLSRSAFDAETRAYDTNLSRYGIAVNADEAEARNTGLGLRRTASMVDAANWTLQRLADRDREIMTGGIQSVKG